MKFKLASTRNVQRIMEAADLVVPRLKNRELNGVGLIYGPPGVGKTVTLDAINARFRNSRRLRTIRLRAFEHWTTSSMFEAILRALGQAPLRARKDAMFQQILDALKSPALILIDQLDSIAGSRSMITSLMDIYDETSSAYLLAGEERVDAILMRCKAFYNRRKIAAFVLLEPHSLDDVAIVIEQRSEIAVAREVVAEIYDETGGQSMRSVVETIQAMEDWGRTNGLDRITLGDYRRLKAANDVTAVKTAPVIQFPEAINA